MVTVTPKAFTRTAPDSSVQGGDTPPSVIVIPDVQLPVSSSTGFQASYSVTVSNGAIDRITIQDSQIQKDGAPASELQAGQNSGEAPTFSTSNGAVPPGGNSQPDPSNAVLIEPPASDYNSDVVTIKVPMSNRLGRLIMTVFLKNPNGQPIPLKFVDPVTHEGVLPGPGYRRSSGG